MDWVYDAHRPPPILLVVLFGFHQKMATKSSALNFSSGVKQKSTEQSLKLMDGSVFTEFIQRDKINIYFILLL